MSDIVKSHESDSDLDALRIENENLRKRITELEALQAMHNDEVSMLQERMHVLEIVVQNSPSVVFVKDHDGKYIVVNKELARLYGTTTEKLLGLSDFDFFPADAAREMRAKDQEAMASDRPIKFEEIVPFDGGLHHYVTLKFPIQNVAGEVVGVCGIASDITELKQQEEERIRMREQIIAAQEEALRELSTPLVPIADGVVAMPLVGAIDEKRAELIVTALLDGVGQQGAHTVIMDITGVRTVDSQVAEALVRAARSVGLLGARVIVTGVRPEVARTLVELGTDLQGIVTRATLRSGIASAIGKKGL